MSTEQNFIVEPRLIFLTGDFLVASAAFEAPLQVVGQTVETDQFMLTKGKAFAKEIAVMVPGEQAIIFCNNDHFYNGIRLAIKNGVIPLASTEFRCYTEGVDGYRLAKHTKEGKVFSAPSDFFGAWETALLELLT